MNFSTKYWQIFSKKWPLFRHLIGRYSAELSAEYSVSADTNFSCIGRTLKQMETKVLFKHVLGFNERHLNQKLAFKPELHLSKNFPLFSNLA